MIYSISIFNIISEFSVDGEANITWSHSRRKQNLSSITETDDIAVSGHRYTFL